MTITTSNAAVTAMSTEQREQFERDGYLVIKGALSESEVDFYAGALDRYYEAQIAKGTVALGASMHHLGAVSTCPRSSG